MANYTIDVNYMTKTCSNLGICFGPKKGQASGTGFAEKLAEKLSVSPKDRDLEEYKRYIYDKISRIPMDSSQSGWQWHVEITDSGLEAMKNDPKYEAEVLSAIRANFAFRDPYQSRNYSVLHFGAPGERSYGESFGGGSRVFGKKEETYWERRQKRRKRLREELEEIQEKKALAKRFASEKYDAKAAQVKAEAPGEMVDMQPPELYAAYEAGIWADLIMRNHFEV